MRMHMMYAQHDASSSLASSPVFARSFHAHPPALHEYNEGPGADPVDRRVSS